MNNYLQKFQKLYYASLAVCNVWQANVIESDEKIVKSLIDPIVDLERIANECQSDIYSELTEQEFHEIELSAARKMQEWEEEYACQEFTVKQCISWWIMKETELYLLNKKVH